MRLMLFFDLPMNNKKERKVYTRFRKYLLKNGFSMIQYSVYAKIFPNRIALFQYIETLKRNIPQSGSIRILAITEKQYEKMQILVGGKTIQEEVLKDETMVIL